MLFNTCRTISMARNPSQARRRKHKSVGSHALRTLATQPAPPSATTGVPNHSRRRSHSAGPSVRISHASASPTPDRLSVPPTGTRYRRRLSQSHGAVKLSATQSHVPEDTTIRHFHSGGATKTSKRHGQASTRSDFGQGYCSGFFRGRDFRDFDRNPSASTGWDLLQLTLLAVAKDSTFHGGRKRFYGWWEWEWERDTLRPRVESVEEEDPQHVEAEGSYYDRNHGREKCYQNGSNG